MKNRFGVVVFWKKNHNYYIEITTCSKTKTSDPLVIPCPGKDKASKSLWVPPSTSNGEWDEMISFHFSPERAWLKYIYWNDPSLLYHRHNSNQTYIFWVTLTLYYFILKRFHVAVNIKLFVFTSFKFETKNYFKIGPICVII